MGSSASQSSLKMLTQPDRIDKISEMSKRKQEEGKRSMLVVVVVVLW